MVVIVSSSAKPLAKRSIACLVAAQVNYYSAASANPLVTHWEPSKHKQKDKRPTKPCKNTRKGNR